MARQRFVVMGAGEVGFHLARSLSEEGHDVTVIELSAPKKARTEDLLDVPVVLGNGAHPPTLAAARIDGADLFMAVSSSDEANLAASLLARELGAKRSVVRMGVAEEVVRDRALLEELFRIDLLLSTQLLTTTRVLNYIRGHNTTAVEYLAEGKVQLRKIHLDATSPLTRQSLSDVELPDDSLVVALFHDEELIVPAGGDKAEVGDDALVLGTTEVIRSAERAITSAPSHLGTVVIAGAGNTGETIIRSLVGLDVRVKVIEIERERASTLSRMFPGVEVLNGDATDIALLRAEAVTKASTFVALSGNDESNLMAGLQAQELGVPQVMALVQRSGTSRLWQRVGLTQAISPRALAYEHIHRYIENGYSAPIVSLKHGDAFVSERVLAEASPVVGCTLAEISPPRGLIVGAVVRGEKVFVPRGKDRLEAGDTVILFVHESEMDTARLLFPGKDSEPEE